jgi:LysM repeat protein
MDVKVLLSHKRSASALVLVSVLMGLLILGSGCSDTTEAASEKSHDLSEDALAPAAPAEAHGNTTLRFDPSPQQVAVGDVVAVQLYLENVDNLYGLEAHLTFDEHIVQVEDDDPVQADVQIASGEIPVPDFTVQNVVDNFGGRLDYAVVQLRPRPAASGSGIVATIRFKGVSSGTSSIQFTKAKLASPDGLEIPAALQAGTIVVSETTDPTPTATPVPTVTPSPSDPTSTGPPDDTPAPAPTPSPGETPTPSTTVSCPVLYVVRSGDTAFSIARRFGIALDDLATANSLSPAFDIAIGQLLIIPDVPGPTGSAHVVQAGDTLYSIARRYNVSVETLAAVNQLPHPWHVSPDQTLWICPP